MKLYINLGVDLEANLHIEQNLEIQLSPMNVTFALFLLLLEVFSALAKDQARFKVDIFVRKSPFLNDDMGGVIIVQNYYASESQRMM